MPKLGVCAMSQRLLRNLIIVKSDISSKERSFKKIIHQTNKQKRNNKTRLLDLLEIVVNILTIPTPRQNVQTTGISSLRHGINIM